MGGILTLLILLSFRCSADHGRDWPPCKVVIFRVGNQYAECENNMFFVHEEYLGAVDMTSHVDHTHWACLLLPCVIFH